MRYTKLTVSLIGLLFSLSAVSGMAAPISGKVSINYKDYIILAGGCGGGGRPFPHFITPPRNPPGGDFNLTTPKTDTCLASYPTLGFSSTTTGFSVAAPGAPAADYVLNAAGLPYWHCTFTPASGTIAYPEVLSGSYTCQSDCDTQTAAKQCYFGGQCNGAQFNQCNPSIITASVEQCVNAGAKGITLTSASGDVIASNITQDSAITEADGGVGSASHDLLGRIQGKTLTFSCNDGSCIGSAMGPTATSPNVSVSCTSAKAITIPFDASLLQTYLPGIEFSQYYVQAYNDARQPVGDKIPIQNNQITIPSKDLNQGATQFQFICTSPSGAQVCSNAPLVSKSAASFTADDLGTLAKISMSIKPVSNLITPAGFSFASLIPNVIINSASYKPGTVQWSGSAASPQSASLSVPVFYQQMANAKVNGYCDDTGCIDNTAVAIGDQLPAIAVNVPNKTASQFDVTHDLFGIYNGDCSQLFLSPAQIGNTLTYNMVAGLADVNKATLSTGYSYNNVGGLCQPAGSLLNLQQNGASYKAMSLPLTDNAQNIFNLSYCAPTLYAQNVDGSWSQFTSLSKISSLPLDGTLNKALTTRPGQDFVLSCRTDTVPFNPQKSNVCPDHYVPHPAMVSTATINGSLDFPACESLPPALVPLDLTGGGILPSGALNGIDFVGNALFNQIDITDTTTGKVITLSNAIQLFEGKYIASIPNAYMSKQYQAAYHCSAANGATACTAIPVSLATAPASLSFKANFATMSLAQTPQPVAPGGLFDSSVFGADVKGTTDVWFNWSNVNLGALKVRKGIQLRDISSAQLSLPAFYQVAGATVNPVCNTSTKLCLSNQAVPVKDQGTLTGSSVLLSPAASAALTPATLGIYSSADINPNPLYSVVVSSLPSSGSSRVLFGNLITTTTDPLYMGYFNSQGGIFYKGLQAGPKTLTDWSAGQVDVPAMTVNIDPNVYKYPTPNCVPTYYWYDVNQSKWLSQPLTNGQASIPLTGQSGVPGSAPGLAMFISCQAPQTSVPDPTLNVCPTSYASQTPKATIVNVADQSQLTITTSCLAPIAMTLNTGNLPGIDLTSTALNNIDFTDTQGKVTTVTGLLKATAAAGQYTLTIPEQYVVGGYKVAYHCPSYPAQGGTPVCTSNPVPVTTQGGALNFTPNYVPMTLSPKISQPAQVFSTTTPNTGLYAAVVVNPSTQAVRTKAHTINVKAIKAQSATPWVGLWTAPNGTTPATISIPSIYQLSDNVQVYAYCNRAATCLDGTPYKLQSGAQIMQGIGLHLSSSQYNFANFVDEGVNSAMFNTFGFYADSQCSVPLTALVASVSDSLDYSNNPGFAVSPDTILYPGYKNGVPSPNLGSQVPGTAQGPCGQGASYSTIASQGTNFSPITLQIENATLTNVPFENCNKGDGPIIMATHYQGGYFPALWFNQITPATVQLIGNASGTLAGLASIPTDYKTGTTAPTGERASFLTCNGDAGTTNVCPEGYQPQAPTYFSTKDGVIPTLNCAQPTVRNLVIHFTPSGAFPDGFACNYLANNSATMTLDGNSITANWTASGATPSCTVTIPASVDTSKSHTLSIYGSAHFNPQEVFDITYFALSQDPTQPQAITVNDGGTYAMNFVSTMGKAKVASTTKR